MNAFDNSEYETARRQYEDEAKQRWGDTAAYREYAQKAPASDAAAGLMAVFGEFAAVKAAGHTPDSETAKNLVKKLQDYITTNFYHCTNEILAGLGQMYVGDERFKNNIDKSGEGTAEFVSEAIEEYCK